MPARICIELTDLAYPIALAQEGRDDFTVTYGKEITCGLSYDDAAFELGEAIMHALACEGRLDNRIPSRMDELAEYIARKGPASFDPV